MGNLITCKELLQVMVSREKLHFLPLDSVLPLLFERTYTRGMGNKGGTITTLDTSS